MRTALERKRSRVPALSSVVEKPFSKSPNRGYHLPMAPSPDV